MTVSLAQAALNTQNDLDMMVIDEFRKSSALLDAMVFHDAVTPSGSGSTLTYGYHRVITERGAAFRALNNEYTAAEATKARYTVDLKPLGGSFEIDRVLAQIAAGAEVSFQLQQLIKSTTTKFVDEAINGDTGVDANGFDGLDKALAGSDTELNEAVVDWSNLDSSGFQNALDKFDEFLMLMDGDPTAVVGNRYSIGKLTAIARRANVYVETPVTGLTGPAGQPINAKRFGNVLLIDAGPKANSSELIVPMYDPDSTVYTITHSAGTDGGTFVLGVEVDGERDQTDALAWNISTANLDTALEGLDNVPASSVTVATTGGAGVDYTVTFGGDLAGRDVRLYVVTDALLDTPVLEPTVLAETGNTGGLTDLYAVRIAQDGFLGVSVAGQPLVQTWLPDFERAGAVKKGEVEMGPVAVALKSTKAAAVLRRIKVR